MADTERRNITLTDEVECFLAECAKLKDAPVTDATAPALRKLQADEVKLRKALDTARVAEKEPHLIAGRAVDAKFNPLIDSLKDAVRPVTLALTKYLEAQEAKRRAEAQAAREAAEAEAARAAALAKEAETEADPFDAFDKTEASRAAEAQASSLTRQAAEPVKAVVANLDGGRAGGLRTVGWIVEVEDPAALVAHYADRMEFLELAKKCAAADAKASKGQAKIPGVRFVADRRAA